MSPIKMPKGLIINLIFLAIVFSNTSVSGQMRQVYIDNTQADNVINNLSFFTPNEGYVAFAYWIGYTTDSGRTFTKKYITNGNVDFNGYSVNLTFGFGIKGVKAFDRNNIIAYGDYGFVPAILHSTDGGNTFKLVYQLQFGFIPSGGITDMAFPQNDNIGYAVDVDQILKTTNKGLTWFVARTDPNSCFDHLETIDDNTVFAVSDYYTNDIYSFNNLPVANNKILKTGNAGSSWQTVNVPAGDIKNASFLTAGKGWLHVNQDLLYTSNAGVNWIQKNNTDVTPFYSGNIKFINDSTGFALSSGFEVIKTTDSGKIWEPLPRDNNFSYLGYSHDALQLFTANQLWAGGGHGFLEISTNGGGTPLPMAYFDIDTTGVYNTHLVKLINYSKAGYLYKWYVNNTLISNSYNTSYNHNIYSGEDSIKLVVTHGTNADSIVKYQFFIPAIMPIPPVITSFSPTTGYQGALITITGTHFTNATAVSFGGVPAQSFNVVSSTTIKATVLTGATGNVSVTTPDGTATLGGFTFIPPPVITSFTPTSGQSGNAITITGSNFTGTTSVSFGGVSATSFTVVSATTISAVPGSGASGTVVVTTPYGTASLGGFTFNNPPAISGLDPYFGGIGETITISGSYFTAATAVTFGDVPAASFTVNSSSVITAILGTGATGNIKVITPYGTALFGSFTYKYPPTITSFAPASCGNGSVVTITGSGFENTGTTVSFGGVAPSSVTIVSPTVITATVGSGASGNITVTTLYGTAQKAGFTWVPAPTITSFTPTSATAGTVVTITGTNFNNASAVSFGGAPASSFTILSSTSITATIGLGSSGNTSVTTPGGTASLSGFTYIASGVPTITSFVPTMGPVGTPVIITGTNFNPDPVGNTVYFGAVKATVTAVSSTSITVMVPPASTYQPVSVTSNNLTAYANQPFIITFPGGNNFSPKSFTGRTDSINLFSSLNVVNVDIDGDGKTDLIIQNGDGLMLWRNTSVGGNISFARTLILPRSYATKITTGDLDGDGKIDIVCSLDNTITVLRNTSTNGVISFTSKAFPCSSPYGVSVNDLNGDGKPEIVTANYSAQSISIFKNITLGSSINFEPEITYAMNYESQGVALRDIDGDGKPDIIVAASGGSSGAPTISVFRNIGAGNIIAFAPHVDFNGGNGVTAVSIGDMDGDGKADVVTTTGNGSSILRNTSVSGTISFDPKYNVPTSGELSFGVSISDLDGDGKPDLAVGEYWFIDSVDVIKNLSTPGNLSFASRVSYATGNFPYGVATGDLNGDGKPDIAVVNDEQNAVDQSTITILKNALGAEIEVCPGSTSKLISDVTGARYQWQQNSGSGFVNITDNTYFSGTASDTLTLSNMPAGWSGYQYRCTVDNNKYSTVYTTHVADPIVPSVQISTPSPTVCTGSPVTFTAIPVNGGSNPTYQWLLNEVHAGTNNSTFITAALGTGDVVKVVMTSSATCTFPVSDTSNTILMNVASFTPEVLVSVSSTNICIGAIATFTATPTNGGLSPIYQWKKNGMNVGTNSVTYSSDSLVNGDIITVSLTSNAACSSPSTVSSNSITMSINSVSPVINISGNTTVNQGTSTTITSAITDGGISPAYQWQDSTDNHSFLDINGASGSTINYVPTATGNEIKCILKSSEACVTASLTTSNVLVFTVSNPAQGNNNGIRYYPNPVHSILNIDSLNINDQWETISITGINGLQNIISQNISGQTKIIVQVDGLTSGMYIVILKRKQGQPVYLKFIKL